MCIRDRLSIQWHYNNLKSENYIKVYTYTYNVSYYTYNVSVVIPQKWVLNFKIYLNLKVYLTFLRLRFCLVCTTGTCLDASRDRRVACIFVIDNSSPSSKAPQLCVDLGYPHYAPELNSSSCELLKLSQIRFYLLQPFRYRSSYLVHSFYCTI